MTTRAVAADFDNIGAFFGGGPDRQLDVRPLSPAAGSSTRSSRKNGSGMSVERSSSKPRASSARRVESAVSNRSSSDHLKVIEAASALPLRFAGTGLCHQRT